MKLAFIFWLFGAVCVHAASLPDANIVSEDGAIIFETFSANMGPIANFVRIVDNRLFVNDSDVLEEISNLVNRVETLNAQVTTLTNTINQQNIQNQLLLYSIQQLNDTVESLKSENVDSRLTITSSAESQTAYPQPTPMPTPTPTIPASCVYYLWSSWSACTKLGSICGTGTQTRSRSVQISPVGLNCGDVSLVSQNQSCLLPPCPNDCGVSDFSNWSACSVSCGQGAQYRTRSVTQLPSAGGAGCPAIVDSQPCNLGDCTGVMCDFSSFGALFPSVSSLNNILNLNCVHITGNVLISGFSDSFTLSTYMGNILSISGNLVLTSLTGLTSFGTMQLQSIGGDFNCSGLSGMSNLNGVQNLVSVSGTLNFSNSGFSSAQGMLGLVRVGRDFVWSNNRALQDLGSWSSLVQVGGSMQFVNLATLSAFTGFSVLKQAGGIIINSTMNNDALKTISLESLIVLDGDLTITATNAMRQLTMITFSTLVSTRSLYLVGASTGAYLGESLLGNVGESSLTKLTAVQFPALSTISGNLVISGSGGSFNSLTELVFNRTTAIGGSLQILCAPPTDWNDPSKAVSLYSALGSKSYSSLQAFQLLATINLPALVTLGGSLQFSIDLTPAEQYYYQFQQCFNALQSISADSLLSIEGDLIIQESHSLAHRSPTDYTSAFPSTMEFSTLTFPHLRVIHGSVSAALADPTICFLSFSNIGSFNLLQSIGGDLSITSLKAFQSIFGFQQLTVIGGTLSLNALPSLYTAVGLSLLHFAYAVSVQNTALVDVNFLDDLSNVNSTTTIQANTKLVMCSSFISRLASVTRGTSTINSPTTNTSC